MHNNKLAQEKYKELDSFIDSLEEKSSMLIAVLHKAQELFGYLPKEVQQYVARKLVIPAAKVNGVVTFYSYFSEEPKGKNVISICMGTACFVKGAEDIMKEFERVLNIKPFETTQDGTFTLDCLRCVGACGLAPVAVVNGKVHARVTIEQVEKIIKECEC